MDAELEPAVSNRLQVDCGPSFLRMVTGWGVCAGRSAACPRKWIQVEGQGKVRRGGICAPGWARGLSSCSGNREVPPSTRKAAEWTKSLQNSLFPKLRL